MPYSRSEPGAARRLRARYREEGLLATMRRVARWVRARVATRDRLIVLVKDLNDIRTPLRRGMVRIEKIDTPRLAELRELNRERGDSAVDARFASDLSAGYGGYVALVDEAVVGFYWWVDSEMRPVHSELRRGGLGIVLGERDVYGFDLYIAEASRGGGIAHDFLYQVEQALHEQRYERIFGGVLANNRSARWLYDARGYQPLWTVSRIHVLGRTFTRHAGRVRPSGNDGRL